MKRHVVGIYRSTVNAIGISETSTGAKLLPYHRDTQARD